VGLDGRFRPLKFGERTLCSPRVLDNRAPLVQVATFLDDPLADDPKPLRTVAWGIAGPRAAKVTVDAPGGRYTAPATPWRAWLNVRAGDIPTYEMVTKVHYPGRRVNTIDYGRARRPSRHPVHGSVTVDARIAAPKGGPDYGLLAWRTENSSICSTNGRLLGDDRVGGWDPQGTFFDYPVGEGASCNPAEMLNRDRPVAYSLGSGWLESEAVLSGVAAPDVEKVIVEGVGSKRELKPGAQGGILALFDKKTSGRLRMTAVFDDGTSRQLPGFRMSLLRRHGAPRLPHLTAVGPKVVPVSPRGSFTLFVSCSEHPSNRKCMSGLYLRSVKTLKRASGLTYQVQMAGRSVRIAPGTKHRPLRLRLSRRGLALLKREHSVAVMASDMYEGGGKHSFRLQLVEKGLGATGAAAPARLAGALQARRADLARLLRSTRPRTPAVVVRPSSPDPTDRVVVAWRVPEPMDNNGDAYFIKFRGPGGTDCSSTETYGGGGISWNVRYNHRYEHRRARVMFGPTRSGDPAPNVPPPAPATAWCTGRYSGSVVFHDYPRGLRPGKHHTSRSCTRAQVRSGNCKPQDRLVGHFEFEIR
jgi:hypothetical protein